jgi:hypothetical protein
MRSTRQMTYVDGPFGPIRVDYRKGATRHPAPDPRDAAARTPDRAGATACPDAPNGPHRETGAR